MQNNEQKSTVARYAFSFQIGRDSAFRLEGIVADMLSDWKDSGRYAQIGRDSG